MADLPSRFGPYEIIAHLGAGGMGRVYRARDTRLHRQVAIKILNDAGALDPDRRRRFAQEAVAASALNHPNIITVFDVGVEGDVPYLVSELIEGVSLRVELSRGRLPLKRAIVIAHQIAEGLCAAHGAGIVHRDLKPENVMVTSDDHVKIVDFGLANTTDDELTASAGSTLTAESVVMGTVPYMSPEQARGIAADFRSDQFAFGVILYEMITGAHPFKRDTSVQTLSAIITDDPPDPAQLNPALPIGVRWLLRRLLAKNSRERFAHTADLAADLRMIREHLAEATANIPEPMAERRAARRLRIAVAAAVIAGAFLAGRLVTMESARPRFDRIVPFATDAGYQGAPSWSPDGKTIAYEAEIDGVIQIFSKTAGSPLRTQLTNSRFDCFSPLWSADGSRIFYHSAAGEKDALWQVSAAGGAPQLLIEGATRSAISNDGQTMVVLKEEETVASMTMWTSSPPGAELKKLVGGELAGRLFNDGRMKFSPDGSTLLAWLWRKPDVQKHEVISRFWSIAMPGGEPRAVLPSLAGFRMPPVFSWLPDNRHIVVLRSDGATPGSHLWVADVNRDRLWPLTETAGNEAGPSVSRDGRSVAFASEATDFDLVEIPLDGSAIRPFWSSTRNEYDPSASPVSTQYAFVTDRTGKPQIWLQNQEGYLQQPLVTEDTFGGEASAAIGSLAFSPDGRRLAFQRVDTGGGEKTGGPRIWISSVTGGTPVALGGTPGYQDAPTWSPDGEWIAYITPWESQYALVKGRLGGAGERVILRKSIPVFIARPQWSPDGKWILCETPDGLTLVSADGNESRVVSDTGWFAYTWSADGRVVYGLRPTEDERHFMFVSVDTVTKVQRVINPNLGTIPPANQPIRGFSRLRGGGFLTSIARVRSDIYVIEGFRPPLPFWRRFMALGAER